MRRKIFFVWLLSFLSIPLFSLYGRPIQLFMAHNCSSKTLAVCLALGMAGLVSVYCCALLKAGVHGQVYHLLWVGVLAVMLYTSLPFVEKIHIAIFGMFGFLTQRVFAWIIAAVLCVAVSFLDELLQHFLVVRVGDWRDVWLNLFSASLGMLLAYLLLKRNPENADREDA